MSVRTSSQQKLTLARYNKTGAKVTGSVVFDGTGDYLSVANNTAFQMGTGDFTAEFFWKGNATGSYTQNIGTQATGADNGSWRIGTRYNNNNNIYFARGNGSAFDEIVYSTNVNDGTWRHIALVRASGVISVYVSGTKLTPSSGSENVSGTCTSSNNLLMGYTPRDGAYISGYMSNVRVVKGTAVYTANFTPPASALTAISGTSLLTCQHNDKIIIDSSPNAFTVTAYDNAAASSVSPF